DLVLRHVKPPQIEEGSLRMLGTILEANPYLGRIVTGRIRSGSVRPNQIVKVLDRDGRLVEEGRVSRVLAFRGLERTGIAAASARSRSRKSRSTSTRNFPAWLCKNCPSAARSWSTCGRPAAVAFGSFFARRPAA